MQAAYRCDENKRSGIKPTNLKKTLPEQIKNNWQKLQQKNPTKLLQKDMLKPNHIKSYSAKPLMAFHSHVYH